ncbi:MAG: gliding motility-associated protein GldE [Bernardetiaceae bacterium]|nr:gliding motility-associated protein GldE [Bernardetiaceae bacterium]
MDDSYNWVLSYISVVWSGASAVPISTILVGTLVLLILLFCSALISGSEVAFFSLTPQEIEEFREGTSTKDRQVSRLLKNPRQLLATILLLNNFINIAIVVISTYLNWMVWGDESVWAVFFQTAVVTTAIVFLGEIVPKVLARQRSVAFAKSTVPILIVSTIALRPFPYLFSFLGEKLEKSVGRKNLGHVSAAQINQVLEMTSHETTGDARKILKGVVDFSEKSVKQIMSSRMEISAVECNTVFYSLLDYIRESGYSRIPVYQDNLDNIIGILYAKDLLPYLNEDANFTWQHLVRSEVLLYVPESKKIDHLFYDFQARRIHMAIVIDEYGGTVGIITLEDIIEEVVGDIEDELDEKNESLIQPLDGENHYLIEAKISLTDMCRELNIDQHYFDEVKGDSESLGGLLLELFSKMPQPEDTYRLNHFVFKIRNVDEKRILSIEVQIKDPDCPDAKDSQNHKDEIT